MKKYLTSFVFLVLCAGYAAFQYLNSSSVAYSAPVATASATTIPQSITTEVSVSQPAFSPSSSQASANENSQQPTQTAPVQTLAQSAPKPQGQYVDGSYTGSTEDAYYGLVQVQVQVSGGKIANVQFLQSPNDRSTSRFINQQAMPLLAQEAIQAQSANVNGVSGASETSGAFVASLSTALAQAHT